ncbi:MAG TPA: M50 family metallopeptidase [Lentimicrobium sp.]|nr:M50 family metallopeptidase [Lentimicrobium sp.]
METLDNWITGNQSLAFYAIMLCSFLFNRLPYAGVFFRTVNTLLHESGHAIGAVLTSGEVVKIELNKDTSGIAQTKSKSKTSAFITSFAGYPFAAAVSSVLLVLSMNGQHKMVAFILLSLVILNLMLFVRNTFGVIWLLLFSGLIIVAVWYTNDVFLKILMMFVAMIAFTETISSTMLITFLAFMKPKRSGDMANMQKTTGIPAAFWGIVNCAVVIWMVYYTIMHYFPDVKQFAVL